MHALAEFALELWRANNINPEGNDRFFKLLLDGENVLSRHVGIYPEVEIGVPSAVAPGSGAKEIHRYACRQRAAQDVPNDCF